MLMHRASSYCNSSKIGGYGQPSSPRYRNLTTRRHERRIHSSRAKKGVGNARRKARHPDQQCRQELVCESVHAVPCNIRKVTLDSPSAASDLELSDARDIFETNLFGTMAMNKEFIPLLIAAQGRIVHVGSIAGILPVPFQSAYNASKAALHSYSDTLRVELAPFK